MGRTGFEPVTSSVSGNDIYRICFRIFALSCCTWSALVYWRPSLSAAIVTQLVTQSPVVNLGGQNTSDQGLEAARRHELLPGLGQGRVDASLIFCQAATRGRVHLPLASSLRLAQGILSPVSRKL